MSTLIREIQQHYSTEDLFGKILSKFSELGKKPEDIIREDLATVDEFHVRGAAVSRELADAIQLQGKKVLDIGSGLGGAARMLADVYDCEVTGIDLCGEYVETAKQLSELVGLSEKISFHHGDATELPFDDNMFDVVWTQHVQMNIQDKQKLYSEIKRVLNSPPLRGGASQQSWEAGESSPIKNVPETESFNERNTPISWEAGERTKYTSGLFLYYDLFQKNEEKVIYPMPWASHEGQSFLMKKEALHSILGDLGFEKRITLDQTASGIDFFENLFAKIAKSGPPKLGLNLLMGESTIPKLKNLLEHLKNGTLELESGVFQLI